MKFHERMYVLHLVLGNSTADPLWVWRVWQQLVPRLDPLIRAASGPAIVRSTQFSHGSKKAINFGQLGWQHDAHQKWTHDSPVNTGQSQTWNFLNTEIWAPGWEVCEREHHAPDFLFAMRNEKYWGESVAFNPTVLLAVAADRSEETKKQAEKAADFIAVLLNCRFRATQVRPWGRPSHSSDFSNAIGDMIVTGLFKPGAIHNHQPSLEILAEKWELR